MNSAAAAAEPVATAVLMILVSVLDDVFVATAGVAVLFAASETADAAADAVFSPSLLCHHFQHFQCCKTALLIIFWKTLHKLSANNIVHVYEERFDVMFQIMTMQSNFFKKKCM